MRKALFGALLALSTAAAAEDTPAAAEKSHADRPAILDAIDLPSSAERARNAGIPTDQVREALGAAKDSGAKPEDSKAIFEEAAAAAEEHGPTDNFGAFVQERLGEGLRGQELAAAIRAEHQANGKGRPAHAGEGKGPDEHGKPDHAGAHGAPEGKGKPEGKGQPASRGAAEGKAGERGEAPSGNGNSMGRGK
ncbi:MAG: hypothetical protein KC912_25875 [Proteobacteria bacterium]|nr:hypothetical protein [Pseudomonadota bacterium]